MTKVRVYELARELNIDSKTIIARLKQQGVKVSSHQSTLADEDAEELRVALQKETGVKPAATTVRRSAAAASPTEETAAKPKVVIRRRRSAAGTQEASEDEASATAAPVTKVVRRERVSTAEPKLREEKPIAPSSIEQTQAVKPSVDDAVEEKSAQTEVASKEAPSDTAAQVDPVEPSADVVAAPPEKVADEVVAKSKVTKSPAKESAKKEAPKSGGATIVRRATPEEVENIESQNRKRQTGKKEDHRGTRVTGSGLLSNRISVDEGQPQATGASSDEWATPAPKKSNFRDAPVVDEDEENEIKKKAAAAKARRAHSALTTRALLSQVDLLEETEEEVPEVAVVKTVYTPSASARKRDLKRRKDLKKTQITTPRAAYRIVEMGETITVGELAKQMATKAADIIKKLMAQGVMATINQDLDFDTATLLAGEYGYEVKSIVKTVDDVLQISEISADELESRPPIVTVMGHVDHGKTSILDAIRKSNVVSGETGGITQHIGAYAVEHNGHKITFLDTPGHEAFSAMRSRGARVTDIVVLVVAADDGVMPQTVEAISHAKAAGVPIIVAVNKIDKPTKNVDRVYTELTEHGVQAEDWGGDTQFIQCSALERIGIDELLDAVILQAEVLELKSTSVGRAQGSVIEAHLDKGRGPVATLVVQRGTLKVGDFIVAGAEYGRVRGMQNHFGREVQIAGPSDPVEIIGLSGVPMAGDQVTSVPDERTAREAADMQVEEARRLSAAKSSAASLEDLLSRVKSNDIPEVNFIIKADTQGSAEAIAESLLKLSNEKVKNRILHSAVGGISESDITLAQTTGAILIGFNVRAARGLDEVADKAGVMIRYFGIIYDIVDAAKAIMVGKLPPIVSEVIVGHAEVRKSISVPKLGTIAGSAVIDGKIVRNAQLRLIRDDVVIYQGKLQSLKRFKDDVREVQTGYECGISIEGYNDIREGDVIEAFVLEESAATLN